MLVLLEKEREKGRERGNKGGREGKKEGITEICHSPVPLPKHLQLTGLGEAEAGSLEHNQDVPCGSKGHIILRHHCHLQQCTSAACWIRSRTEALNEAL